MKVRITCDHCSGELELPGVPAGQEIRCPMCGELLISTIAAAPPPAKSRPAPAKSALRESTRWAPAPDDDFDNDGVPWFIWLGVFAPAGLLWFVAIEPIACAVAGGLVLLSVFVALRGSWPRWSRVMGITSIALLGFAAAVAANLYAQGNFANFKIGALFAGFGGPTLESENIRWQTFASPDDNFSIDFPDPPTRTENKDRPGVEIVTYETKYRRQTLAFAVHVVKFPHAKLNEQSETETMATLEDVVRWLYFHGQEESKKAAFFFDHPGIEFQFAVLDFQTTPPTKKLAIECRAFLVGDRAYVVSVTAPPDKADVKPIADRFLASFRLLQRVPNPSMIEPDDSDGRSLKRPPIPVASPVATYLGHPKAPITALAFSRDGKKLFSGSNGEHLVLWDVGCGFGVPLREGEGMAVFAPHPSGAAVVIRVRGNLAGWLPILKPKVPALGAANADLITFPAGDALAIYAAEDRVEGVNFLEKKKDPWPIMSIRLPTFWDWLDAPDSPITSLAATSDGRLVAAVSRRDATITMRDTATKRLNDVVIWTAHDLPKIDGAPIQQIVFSPDGAKLASAGLDGKVKVWSVLDVKKPKLIAALPHDDSVVCLDYSSNGKLLATGDFAGVVRIWDGATNKLVHEFRAGPGGKQQVQFMRFSPDNERLAVGVEMGKSRAGVNLYEIKSLPRVEGDAAPPRPAITDEEPPLSKEPKKK